MNKKELRELKRHIDAIQPDAREFPRLKGHDIFGVSIPLNEPLGGDHIIYLDYKERFFLDHLLEEIRGGYLSAEKKLQFQESIDRTRAKVGILLADVSGHDLTDALLTYGFHQAFLTAVSYELKLNGEVTLDLIDVLNNRFLNSYSRFKFVTVIYAEFHENGDFRFVSAGHPLPLIYSYEQGAVCNLHKSSYASSMPMSVFPAFENTVEQGQKKQQVFSRFSVNKSHIPNAGDIVMLYSDGLLEHADSQGNLFYDSSALGKGGRIQQVINGHRDCGARELVGAIKEDLLRFASPRDDISFVVIRRQ